MIPAKRLRRPAAFLLACYWLTLVVATHIPLPPEEVLPLGSSDKLLHWGAYAVLAFLASLNWALWRPLTWRAAALLWASIAAFGAIDEVTQIPVGRQGDPADWIADVAGALCGIALFELVWLAVRRFLPEPRG